MFCDNVITDFQNGIRKYFRNNLPRSLLRFSDKFKKKIHGINPYFYNGIHVIMPMIEQIRVQYLCGVGKRLRFLLAYWESRLEPLEAEPEPPEPGSFPKAGLGYGSALILCPELEPEPARIPSRFLAPGSSKIFPVARIWSQSQSPTFFSGVGDFIQWRIHFESRPASLEPEPSRIVLATQPLFWGWRVHRPTCAHMCQ